MNPPMIRAISLWQPWATLIALRLKLYETRHWETAYRGDLLIHASRKNDSENQADMRDPDVRAALRAAGLTWEQLPFGAAVCVVSLVDCLPTSEIPLRERRFGNFNRGRFAWKVTHIRVLPEPIPMRGQQGFWSIPNPLKKVPPEPLLPPHSIQPSNPVSSVRRQLPAFRWQNRAAAMNFTGEKPKGEHIPPDEMLGWLWTLAVYVPISKTAREYIAADPCAAIPFWRERREELEQTIAIARSVKTFFKARAAALFADRRFYLSALREGRMTEQTARPHIKALNEQLRRMSLAFWQARAAAEIDHALERVMELEQSTEVMIS